MIETSLAGVIQDWQAAIAHPYGLLAYPQGDIALQQQRLNWLNAQNIHQFYSYGPKPIGQWHILGLGYCGLVVLVKQANRLLALKLRRTDAPNASLKPEAEAIALANHFHIGPQLFSYSNDCLLMEYLPGPKFIDWLHSPAATLEQVGSILQQLLSQAFQLDQAGLDHGDLRCVTEHVHIEAAPSGHRPVLIDFSKVSCDRRPANVTTLTQGLFLSTTIAKTISERFPQTALDCQQEPRRSQLLQLLRAYKKNPCHDAHKTLLNFLTP